MPRGLLDGDSTAASETPLQQRMSINRAVVLNKRKNDLLELTVSYYCVSGASRAAPLLCSDRHETNINNWRWVDMKQHSLTSTKRGGSIGVCSMGAVVRGMFFMGT